MTSETVQADIRTGTLGRIAAVRLRPNLDLAKGVEEAARQVGFRDAVIRSAVGSLVDAGLQVGNRVDLHQGPGIEILSLNGEVQNGAAVLRGTISKPDRSVHGGEFVHGENPICITLELVLQEWVPSPAGT